MGMAVVGMHLAGAGRCIRPEFQCDIRCYFYLVAIFRVMPVVPGVSVVLGNHVMRLTVLEYIAHAMNRCIGSVQRQEQGEEEGNQGTHRGAESSKLSAIDNYIFVTSSLLLAELS